MRRAGWRTVVAPEAVEDVRAASAYYRTVAPEQVRRFAEAVRSTVRLIRAKPLLAAEDDWGMRHQVTDGFPYGVWYRVDDSERIVFVVGVVHLRRDPWLIRRR